MSEWPRRVNFRNKGHKLCMDHPKEELLLVCKDCNKTLVCIHCVSTTHVGHQLIAVNLIVQENLKFLQDWNIDTVETKIPRLSRRVEEAATQVKEFQQSIHVHIRNVQENGKYLKDLVEKSTTETVYELKEIETKILQQFDTFKSNSDKAKKQLKYLMKESREVTQAHNNVLLLDFTKELSSQTIQEPEFECTSNNLKFTKGLNPESLVKAAFGRLSHERNSSNIVTVKQERSTLSQNTFGKHGGSISKTVTVKQERSTLLQNPTSSQLGNTSVLMRTVTRTKQGTLWFCELGKPYLYKKDRNGPLQKQPLTVKVKDISIHPLNDQLFCIANNSVYKVNTTTMTTTEMFRADDPVSMAMTHIGNILVKTKAKSKLTLYTCTGTIVQTVTKMHTKNNHISVCRATGKVALSCMVSGVSVLTDQLQLMFTYPSSGDKINAWDATFDNGGHLLIADCTYNKSIHIIDATTGQLQKSVPVENVFLVCLTTYSNNSVVVCTNNPNQILSIKYSD